MLDGRKSEQNRERARASASRQWTLDRRKSHALRAKMNETSRAAVLAMDERQFSDYVTFRENRFSVVEAIAKVTVCEAAE
jgi:hypothetical protein